MNLLSKLYRVRCNMKLLKSQYQDIVRGLEDFDIKIDRLSLVKKKGRIRIHIEGRASYFEFFHRKFTSLTPESHQWEKSGHFELNVDGVRTLEGSWDGVMSSYRSWLKLQFD